MDGQVLDRCTRTPPYCQALISKVKSDFKNTNLGVLCDLKKSGKYAKNGSPPPQKTVPLFCFLTKVNLSSKLIVNCIKFKYFLQLWFQHLATNTRVHNMYPRLSEQKRYNVKTLKICSKKRFQSLGNRFSAILQLILRSEVLCIIRKLLFFGLWVRGPVPKPSYIWYVSKSAITIEIQS